MVMVSWRCHPAVPVEYYYCAHYRESFLQEKVVEATKQKEGKRRKPEPEEQEGMPQHYAHYHIKFSYKKKQWRPPSKKKKRGKNLSPTTLTIQNCVFSFSTLFSRIDSSFLDNPALVADTACMLAPIGRSILKVSILLLTSNVHGSHLLSPKFFNYNVRLPPAN
jgi:hypothetical protein